MASRAKVVSHIDVSKVLRGVRKGATQGMALAVEHVLTEANKRVPHDEGTLERSGRATVLSGSKGVLGVVSYDTPYAVRQHEDMTLNHHGKGESKWLENTMAAERETVGKIIAAAIRKELDS